MLRLSFFRNIKPRSFNYEARYYDAEKEDLERRLAKADKRNGEDIAALKLRIADGLHQRGADNKAWKSQLTRQSNVRFVVVLMVILVIVCVLLFMYYPLILQFGE